jgi:hypothetical protein
MIPQMLREFIVDLDPGRMRPAADKARVYGISRHRFAAGLFDEFFEETLFRAKQRY